MAELFRVSLVIYGWPSAAIEPRETFRGRDYPDAIRFEAVLTAMRRAAHALGWDVDPPADVEYDADRGELRISAQTVNYGTYALKHDGLADALREAGLAFYAFDVTTTARDCHPRFVAWRPGWEALREGYCNGDGDVLIDQAMFSRLVASQPSVGEGALRVVDWFETPVLVAAREETTTHG